MPLGVGGELQQELLGLRRGEVLAGEREAGGEPGDERGGGRPEAARGPGPRGPERGASWLLQPLRSPFPLKVEKSVLLSNIASVVLYISTFVG